MLIIFDVDGTLLRGEQHDWAAFDASLHRHLGFVHTPGFFSRLNDVTAENVVMAAARACGRDCTEALKAEVRAGYLAGLRVAHATAADAFPARRGVGTLLSQLRRTPGFAVALATGDWLPTISFKLQCAQIDVSEVPIATSSDAPTRPEIIRLAAARAGRPLTDAVYVGDGVWDLWACRQLGIPFIGTGARLARLIDAGVEHTCAELEPEAFLEVLPRVRTPRSTPSIAG